MAKESKATSLMNSIVASYFKPAMQRLHLSYCIQESQCFSRYDLGTPYILCKAIDRGALMCCTVHHAPYALKLPMQKEGNTNNHDWKRPGLAEICRPSLGLFSICKSHINQPKSTGGPHYCNPDLPLLSCLAAGVGRSAVCSVRLPAIFFRPVPSR
jgi:hypothetical protein